jgi:hypothetical protein
MIVSLILLLFGSIFKAISDNIKFHWSKSIFLNIKNQQINNWFNPSNYTNMYKDGDPTKDEKYFGSSRWFAFLNDGWHLFSMLQILCYIYSLTFYSGYLPIVNNYVDGFVIYCLSGIIFELLYGKLLNK